MFVWQRSSDIQRVLCYTCLCLSHLISPDIILCDWLGSKRQQTNKQTVWQGSSHTPRVLCYTCLCLSDREIHTLWEFFATPVCVCLTGKFTHSESSLLHLFVLVWQVSSHTLRVLCYTCLYLSDREVHTLREFFDTPVCVCLTGKFTHSESSLLLLFVFSAGNFYSFIHVGKPSFTADERFGFWQSLMAFMS